MNKKILIIGLIAAICIAALVYVMMTYHGFYDVNACSDWPMFQHDPQHTGFSDCNAPDTNETLWITQLPGTSSSPVVVDGVVFIGTNEGLYALREIDGEIMWKNEKIEIVYSTPLVLDDMLFIGGDKYVYGVNKMDGEIIWEKELSKYVIKSSFGKDNNQLFIVGEASNIIKNNSIILRFEKNVTIYALNSKNGEVIWKYTIKNDTIDFSSPVFYNEIIFISTNHKVCALNASNGIVIWNQTFSSKVISSQIVHNNKLFVADSETVYALSISGGGILWRYPTKDEEKWIYSTPATANGILVIGSKGGFIHALNESSGGLIWKVKTPITCIYKVKCSGLVSSPVIADGKVFIGGGDGVIYTFNLSNGNIIWEYKTSYDMIYSSPAISAGKMFIADEIGNVYAFGNKK